MRCREQRANEVRAALGPAYADLTEDQCATISGRWARARRQRAGVKVHDVCSNFLKLWLETKRRAEARAAEQANLSRAAEPGAKVEVVA